MNTIYLLLMSSVYIFNISQHKYLAVDADGQPSFSDQPVAVSLGDADAAGRHAIEGSGGWTLIPTSADTWAVGNLVADANAGQFLYASATAAVPGSLAATYAQPDPSFEAAQWLILQTGDDAAHQAVSLDEGSTVYTRPALTKALVDVTLKRSFTTGRWNALCLPFAMTGEQIQAAWGNGTDKARVAQFVRFDEATSTARFSTVESMEAGKPYAVYVPRTAADNTYTIEGIEATTWQRADAPADTESGGMAYRGQYIRKNAPQGSYIFGTDDKLHLVTTDRVGMRGFRACLIYGDGTQQLAKPLSWNFGDDTPTGIGTAAATGDVQWPADIYSTDGTLVRRAATSAQGLPAGIYVAHGKKIVVVNL